MTNKQQTLGQAIDQIIDALTSLEPNSRQTAIEAACAHLGVQLRGGSPAATQPPTSSALTKPLQTTSAPLSPTTTKRMDIRALKEEKRPSSAKQMACVVAYYLQELAPEAERKETTSTADLEKYFKQAGFKLPKAIKQVLPDAKSSGYFESASHGEYKLNAVGYNLVVHNLPQSKGE